MSTKERPMLFTAPMVRALLDGSKTQTRRLVKITHRTPGLAACLLPPFGAPKPNTASELCRYGRPGDRLWIRENYRFLDSFDADSPSMVGDLCLAAGYGKAWAPTQYEADGDRRNWMQVGTPPHAGAPVPGKFRPSIHMPRWASRILLEVVSVRVERLNDCSEADAIAEGCEGYRPDDDPHRDVEPRDEYRELWESINGAGSWVANPWVWVIEFKRVGP